MKLKTISHKRLIQNAKALGVEFKKEAKEKRFILALIIAAIVLAISVGLSFAIDKIKDLFFELK